MVLVLLEQCAAAFIDADAHCPHPSLQGSGTDSIPVEGTPELPRGHAAAAAPKALNKWPGFQKC